MKNKFIISGIVGVLIALSIILGLIQRSISPDPIPQESSEKINLQSEGLGVLGVSTSTPSLPEKIVATAPNLPEKTVATTFTAGGDVSLSRFIAYNIDKSKNPLLPFEGLTSVLNEADFNFANLESPFSQNDHYKPNNTLVFNAPKKNIEGLVKYKFKIMNLANNHALDQGEIGVSETLKHLEENGIASVGLGKNSEDAYAGKIIESNGIKIGFVCASYASFNDGGEKYNEFVARMEDTQRLTSEILKLKMGSDFVVACMHGGNEYSRKPNEIQKNFARSAIDAGADMVIGHHPHWIQPIERYKGKYIFYSLGNLVFDQDWSQETKEGLMLKVSLEKNITTRLKEVELIGVQINQGLPQVADEKENKKLLTKIGEETSKLEGF